jgi:DHA1 family bicyclomycin/chloramphenicol resistance-like MFS transporter
MVITRAIVRDRFSRDDGAKVLALLFMVMSIAPMAAPTVGGQVLLFAGWRAIFWLLAALGIISLILTVRPLRESLAPDKRTTHKVGAMVTSYGQLLKNRRFVGYALCNAFSFGGMFAYIAGSPFVIIELMGVSPQVYGLLFALHVLGLSAGAFISSRLVTRYGVDKLLAAGAVGIAVAGVAVASVGYTGAGLIPLLITVVPFMIFLSIVGANSMAGGMAEFPQIAGTASALLGAVPLSCGALVSALVSTFHDGTAVPMTFAMGTVGVLALLTLLFVVRGSAPAAVE